MIRPDCTDGPTLAVSHIVAVLCVWDSLGLLLVRGAMAAFGLSDRDGRSNLYFTPTISDDEGSQAEIGSSTVFYVRKHAQHARRQDEARVAT